MTLVCSALHLLSTDFPDARANAEKKASCRGKTKQSHILESGWLDVFHGKELTRLRSVCVQFSRNPRALLQAGCLPLLNSKKITGEKNLLNQIFLDNILKFVINCD